ncbi:hypothetical protein N431DRAFT_474518 [Stipitochalara longipes BDJ]|nr:hypothetical protein N431DRAFT_474518 [Stipitochalara longipes BDJ]
MIAYLQAVKGFDWDGSEPDFAKVNFGYGAIHFHEDDLDDTRWSTDFSITIPSTVRSGAYALEVKTQDSISDMITFFVRPNPASTNKVALVLSTFTYLAYANEYMWDQTRSSAIVVPDDINILELGRDYERMVKRSDLGLSVYDVHRDGSGWNAAISQYSTLITGCHPEYPSLQTLDTYTGFAKFGGKIIFLGGNGFYWVSETDPQQPYRLEVRKGRSRLPVYHTPSWREDAFSLWRASSPLNPGRLWRSRGRTPNYRFGIGFCTFGTGQEKPYVRNSQHNEDPAFSWGFKGVESGELTGVNGFGGGGSGDEIDRLHFELGSTSNKLLLASSQQHDDTFGLFNEEQMWPMVITLGSDCDRVRSDMTYYQTSGRGVVFSVGNINWYRNLAWDGYLNNVAKITDNVLREYLKRGKGDGEVRP